MKTEFENERMVNESQNYVNVRSAGEEINLEEIQLGTLEPAQIEKSFEESPRNARMGDSPINKSRDNSSLIRDLFEETRSYRLSLISHNDYY